MWTSESEGPIGGAQLALLCFWVYLLGFVRAGKASYGGFVAQFTPFIMISVPFGRGSLEHEALVFKRIQQNMIAVVAFVLVEVSDFCFLDAQIRPSS